MQICGHKPLPTFCTSYKNTWWGVVVLLPLRKLRPGEEQWLPQGAGRPAATAWALAPSLTPLHCLSLAARGGAFI